MNPVETEQYRGYTIKIYQDEDPTSPRDWDNLGTMICWHRRYELGDVQEHQQTPEEFDQWWKENGRGGIRLPLALLDHSGLSMWVGSGAHACDPGGWDSGQVGLVYVTADRLRKEYSVKRISAKVRALAEKVITQEVKVYDEYLQGDVYGYWIEDENGAHLDSCWGYFGSDKEHMMDCAHDSVDHIAKNAAVAPNL